MTYRQAIIFDMDGLMVDSEPLSRQAWNQLLQGHGYHMTDDIYRQMIGFRTDYSAKLILNYFPLPMTATEIVTEKETIFYEIRAKGVPAMPGLMTLQAIIKERKIPWAVATSSSRDHAQIILAQLGLSDDCHAIAAGNEVESSKPAPDIYLLAAKRLGINPAFCIALEDSAPGCQAAAAAGMKVIVIPHGDTKTAVFSCATVQYTSLLQVIEHLDVLLAN